jgi:ABC-type multidrug transport system permease subunit
MKIITKSLSKPGVLTQESQPSLIPIYQEETYFKRNNLARFDALTAYGKSQTSFKIAFIVIASVSLLVILILSFMIWRWSKGLIQLEESLE